jgi:alkyl hydroperoxide reductase subunit AhpF
MPLLRPEDAEAIQKEFAEHLQSDVTVTLVGPSALNPPARDLTRQIKELYGEVAALSPHVKYQYLDLPTPEQRAALGLQAGEGGPLTVISGAAKGRVRFVGGPLGYEFGSFIRGLIDVARGESGLTAESRQKLAKVKSPVHIRVFFTPT